MLQQLSDPTLSPPPPPPPPRDAYAAQRPSGRGSALVWPGVGRPSRSCASLAVGEGPAGAVALRGAMPTLEAGRLMGCRGKADTKGCWACTQPLTFGETRRQQASYTGNTRVREPLTHTALDKMKRPV